MTLAIGHELSRLELIQMIHRVQTGQTTFEQEMINNLGENMWESIDTLRQWMANGSRPTIILWDARDGSICRAQVTEADAFVTEHSKRYTFASNVFYSHWMNVSDYLPPPKEQVEAWKEKKGL